MSKQLHSKEKAVIASISESCKRKSRKSRNKTAFDIEKTIQTTGVSKSTIYRIRKEQKEAGILTSHKRYI